MNTETRGKALFARKGIKTVNMYQINSLLGGSNLILTTFTCKFAMI